MIRKRDPGHFGWSKVFIGSLQGLNSTPSRHIPFVDEVAGPVIISALLFVAVLANFVFRGPYAFLPFWCVPH